jgi:TIR domain
MPGIFISYRRDDVPGQVGRIFGRLAEHYGEDFVFMDVESINLSQDFEQVIKKRINDSDIVLLAIGPKWRAQRQLAEGERDFLRMELDEAIAGKRPLGPLLIDRREELEAADLPVEVQKVLASHALEIRHSTFDRDIDAVVLGLEKQGIRPPEQHRRRRAEAALAAAGWPYSWFGSLTRALTPVGVVIATWLMVAAAAGVAGWWAYRTAYDRGLTDGDKQGRAAMDKQISKLTADYEGQIGKDQRDGLQISGMVTDGGTGIEGATITLTNRRTDEQVSDTTDSRGVYNVNLEKISVAMGDFVRVEVTKPNYRKTTETVKYQEDFREFRLVLRK